MSASPNKRQRTAGSFSPASPPYHLAFAQTDERTKIPHDPPRTPTSPPFMSQPLVITTTNPFPTPASSTAGVVTSAAKDSDGDAQMSEGLTANPSTAAVEDTVMSNTGEHRRTDHDRQGEDGSATSEKMGLERLNADMGPLYKLCKTPYRFSRPHPSENLISLYGLDSIAASVARKDPATGEKINKLRKSYEGHIKNFKLAGKNKSVSKPGELFDNLLMFPDAEWYGQKVMGKVIGLELPASIMSKLDSAVRMAPGKLPAAQNEKWRGIVGADDVPKAKAEPDGATKLAQPLIGQAQAAGRASAAPSPALKPARPDRAGKKRRYNDESFKGYGEGYADDDLANSTGGEDDGRVHGFKKRRKDYSGGPMGMNSRTASYKATAVGGH